MKNHQLTDNTIVAHFRAQADKYNQMADTIENGLSAGQTRKKRAIRINHNLPDPGPLTLDNVRKLVKARGHRAADIAVRFKVPVRKIEELIANPKNGLVIGSRGWIKAKRAKS